MDAAERAMFEEGLRRVCGGHSDASLDTGLEDLGWEEALDSDERTAVAALFGAQGAAGVCSSALNEVLRHALGVAATGAGVVLPALGQCAPPGSLDAAAVSVRGLGSAGLSRHREAVVVASAGEKQFASVVPLRSLRLLPLGGIDPAYGLVAVEAELATGDWEPVDWGRAVAIGQLAIGHELVGASRSMLDLAREHALTRVQFGRTISAFQAVRHRLADTLVAVETAAAALDASWVEPSPVAAAMAKAVAGRSALTAARHCQQVLAGLGFTAEHPLHRYVRRVHLLDNLIGSSRALTEALGKELARSRTLPPMAAL